MVEKNKIFDGTKATTLTEEKIPPLESNFYKKSGKFLMPNIEGKSEEQVEKGYYFWEIVRFFFTQESSKIFTKLWN